MTPAGLGFGKAASILLAWGLACASLAGPALADDGPALSWEVYPAGSDAGEPYFTADVPPGGTFTGLLGVRNHSEVPLTLALWAADASTGAEGEFMIHETDTGRDAVLARWFEPETSALSLPPEAEAAVAFTIAIPDSAPPGDYGGALMTSLVADPSDETDVVARVGVRVHLRIQGDLMPWLDAEDLHVERRAAWWNPFVGDVTVQLTAANTGNSRLSVAGTARTNSALGSRQARLAPAGLELWPRDALPLTATVRSARSFFTLTTEVTLTPVVISPESATGTGTDGTSANPTLDPVTVSVRLIVVPWLALAVLALMLAAAARWVVIRRRRSSSGRRRRWLRRGRSPHDSPRPSSKEQPSERNTNSS